MRDRAVRWMGSLSAPVASLNRLDSHDQMDNLTGKSQPDGL